MREPLTLILSPLRAGRGELELNHLGLLFGDPDTVPPKVPLSLLVSVYRGRTRRSATSSAASSGAKASRKRCGTCEPFRRCTRRGCRSATTATAKQISLLKGRGSGGGFVAW